MKQIFKVIIICLTLHFNLNASVIYDKDNIIVTIIDLETFSKLYLENYKVNLSKIDALKEIILLKRFTKRLKQKNINAYKNINEMIAIEYGENLAEDSVVKDFLISFKLKNEFQIEYIQNELSFETLKEIFLSFEILELQTSLNKCKTINEIVDLRDNESFIRNFLLNIKKNTQDYFYEKDKGIFYICFDNDSFQKIETKLLSHINQKVDIKYKKFLYED